MSEKIKKVLGSRIWLSDVYSQSQRQDGSKAGLSIQHSKRSCRWVLSVRSTWICSSHFSEISSAFLRSVGHASAVWKSQGNNPESLQKAATFKATNCAVKEGFFFLMACWCHSHQKDKVQSQMQHAFSSRYGWKNDDDLSSYRVEEKHFSPTHTHTHTIHCSCLYRHLSIR